MADDRIISEQSFALKQARKEWIKLALTLLLGGGLVGFLGCVFIPRSTPGRFRSLVERDLPIGTERSKVEDWLKERGLSGSDVYDEKYRRVGLFGEFHKYYVDILGESFIRFEFHFDKQERLTKFSVWEFHLFL